MKLVTKNELAFSTFESVTTVADLLLAEGYVVMLSREEQLYILNYEWSSNRADRNDVVFMDREEFDDNFYNRHDIREDEAEDDIQPWTDRYPDALNNTYPEP